MNQDQLKAHMKYYLSAFKKKDNPTEIDDDTVHQDILSSRSIRAGIPTTKEQYKDFVRTSLIINSDKPKKEVDKPWPPDWMKFTVADLASKLIPFLIFLFVSIGASAQVNLDVSTIKTDLRNNAINVGIHYLQTWDSLFKVQDVFSARNNHLVQLSPSFDVQTGTADAFSSIQAKISGMFMFFKTTEVAGAKAVDVSKTWHIVPIAAGVETNNKFNVWNGILEVGYVPWYQSELKNSPEWIRNTTLAFFVQGGYKFSSDTANLVGGEIDQSKEKSNSAILRLKGDVSANIFNPVRIGTFRVGLVGGATVWYDVLNTAVYDKLDADLRFFVTGNDDFISLKYQHGSGAPLFNTGDQFGIGLSVSF